MEQFGTYLLYSSIVLVVIMFAVMIFNAIKLLKAALPLAKSAQDLPTKLEKLQSDLEIIQKQKR